MGLSALISRTAVAGAVSVVLVGGGQVPAPRLTASALMMGGTNQVLSIPPKTPAFIADFVAEANRAFIAPSGLCVGGDPGCALVAVYTPEQMRFVTGFDDLTLDESVSVGQANLDLCLRGGTCRATSAPFSETALQQFTDTSNVVQGISQSAVISTYEKSNLIAHPVDCTRISFVLVSNPNRPNGGVLERFIGSYIPLLGITFNGATPTNSPEPTPLPTVDVAHQYDGWVDFPTNPVNVIADANALLGALFLHSRPLTVAGATQLQGYYQDSTYYLEASPVLPLLIPLAAVPFVGSPLAAVLDPPLRVLVEAGYDRTINPGQPTPAQWHYTTNLIDATVNLIRSVPTGWDNAIADITDNPANRPFHTEPQGAYGVGGPPVYAGAVDPYGNVPAPSESTVAQKSRAPGPAAVAEPITEQSVPSARMPDRSAWVDNTPANEGSVRHGSRAKAHPGSIGSRRDYSSSSKIATARVQPAEAA